MDTSLPFGLPGDSATYLALYLGTLAVHWAFAAYVAVGTGYLSFSGVRGRNEADDALAKILRDWLPFFLSAAITLGVAPLLFVQVLYPHSFYSANLLLSHRWMSILPVLIVGFYLLYVIKRGPKASATSFLHRLVRLLALACFLYTAWSWSENHLLSIASEKWPAFHESGRSTYFSFEIVPRFLFFACGAVPVACTILAAQVRVSAAGQDLHRAVSTLARLSVSGALLALAAGCWYAVWLHQEGRVRLIMPMAGVYLVIGFLAAATLTVGWALRWNTGRLTGGWIAVLLSGSAVVLMCVAAVRESIRLAVTGVAGVVPKHAEAAEMGGLALFLVFMLINAMVAAWCVRAARTGKVNRPEVRR